MYIPCSTQTLPDTLRDSDWPRLRSVVFSLVLISLQPSPGYCWDLRDTMTSVRSETCKQDPVSNYIILLKPKVSLKASENSGTNKLWSFSSHMSIHLLDSQGLWSTMYEIQWGQWLTPLSPSPCSSLMPGHPGTLHSRMWGHIYLTPDLRPQPIDTVNPISRDQ